GPHDGTSVHRDTSMRWKIKRFSDDGLGQKFVDVTVPQAQFLGLTVADTALRWDADNGHYVFGEPDWDEFRAVLRGEGPCNRQRLAHRRRAHDDGAWVREAAEAHAAQRKAAVARASRARCGGRPRGAATGCRRLRSAAATAAP